MVQRYLLQGGLIGPHDDGDWVGYEDYKDLDDDFQDYITTTDMEIEGLVSRLAEVNAELQKYKDQFPDYVECANCGSVTHVECEHVWNRYIVHPHRKICLVCGVKE